MKLRTSLPSYMTAVIFLLLSASTVSAHVPEHCKALGQEYIEARNAIAANMLERAKTYQRIVAQTDDILVATGSYTRETMADTIETITDKFMNILDEMVAMLEPLDPAISKLIQTNDNVLTCILERE